ncbi:hypothetical protein HK100_002312 [Physocladia obscura]|uniref:C2H2-type domain-containing protein n=1 Tax=Physocladia obscura TaxID=109957 RepID=A0AAD5SXP0_9FUNG|nr:hypothetical protein HK100_002312 [Physocladia obscura]
MQNEVTTISSTGLIGDESLQFGYTINDESSSVDIPEISEQLMASLIADFKNSEPEYWDPSFDELVQLDESEAQIATTPFLSCKLEVSSPESKFEYLAEIDDVKFHSECENFLYIYDTNKLNTMTTGCKTSPIFADTPTPTFRPKTIRQNSWSSSGTYSRSEFFCHFENCTKIYKSNASLKYHVNRFHYKKLGEFVCDVCEKVYTTKNRLTVHKRNHTGERPFRCEIPGCGYSTTQKCALTTHGSRKHI